MQKEESSCSKFIFIITLQWILDLFPFWGLPQCPWRIYCRVLPHSLQTTYFICHGLLCTAGSISKSRASLLKSLWHHLDPGLVSPYCLYCVKLTKKKPHLLVGFKMEQKIFTVTGRIPPVAENWQNQPNAICSLILPLFQKLFEEMDHASSWKTWSRPEKNPSSQNAGTCVANTS